MFLGSQRVIRAVVLVCVLPACGLSSRSHREEADVRLHLLLPLAVGVCCELLILAFVRGSMVAAAISTILLLAGVSGSTRYNQ